MNRVFKSDKTTNLPNLRAIFYVQKFSLIANISKPKNSKLKAKFFSFFKVPSSLRK